MKVVFQPNVCQPVINKSLGYPPKLWLKLKDGTCCFGWEHRPSNWMKMHWSVSCAGRTLTDLPHRRLPCGTCWGHPSHSGRRRRVRLPWCSWRDAKAQYLCRCLFAGRPARRMQSASENLRVEFKNKKSNYIWKILHICQGVVFSKVLK